MGRILIKPAPGKLLREPVAPYKPIPPEGIVRIDAPEYRRLELHGDAIITDADVKASAKASK